VFFAKTQTNLRHAPLVEDETKSRFSVKALIEYPNYAHPEAFISGSLCSSAPFLPRPCIASHHHRLSLSHSFCVPEAWTTTTPRPPPPPPHRNLQPLGWIFTGLAL
ncbi:hypothetical protein EJB05_25128, partial [Eragrostis curvula]